MHMQAVLIIVGLLFGLPLGAHLFALLLDRKYRARALEARRKRRHSNRQWSEHWEQREREAQRKFNHHRPHIDVKVDDRRRGLWGLCGPDWVTWWSAISNHS